MLEKLQETGFTTLRAEEQAEALREVLGKLQEAGLTAWQAEALGEVLEENLPTQQNLKEAEALVRESLKTLKGFLHPSIQWSEPVPSFDTLTYAKKLQEAGFTARQAEAQAEALRDVLGENIATQQNLKDVEGILRRDLKELETSLKRDLKELEVRLTQQLEFIRKDMEVMRRDTVIWLGGLIVVSITALGILMKLL